MLRLKVSQSPPEPGRFETKHPALFDSSNALKASDVRTEACCAATLGNS